MHWDLARPGPGPYANGYHPFAWRGWCDFGTGALGDMACHTMNMPYMALDLRDPTSVEARPRATTRIATDLVDHQVRVPGHRQAAGRDLTWYDGKKLPPIELFQKVKWPAEAIKDGPKQDKAETFETSISAPC